MKTLAVRDLAEAVAKELNTPAPQAQAVLDRALAMMKHELQHGNQIQFPDFLTMAVQLEKAAAVKSVANAALHLPPARRVTLALDEGFRKSVEGAQVFQVLLVIPQRNFFTGVLAAQLSSPRSEVKIIEGEEPALAELRQRNVDLVVLDVGLKEPQRICELVKKHKSSSYTAVVRVYGEGEDPKRVDGFEVQADERISEPFDLADLVKLAEAELSRSAEERNYFDHSLHLKLQTTEEFVDQSNDFMAELIGQSGLDEDSGAALAVAFREAIDNAARHGNKYEEDKPIDVQYLVDQEKVTIAVTDGGEGFDTEIYLSRGVGGNPVEAARERHQAGGAGGLGIMLMLKCVDKLEYNYIGNKISLTKLFKKNKA